MANANINTIQVTSTFDEWRVATNDLITDRNLLRNHPYVKDNSNFRMANGAISIARSTGGTLLTIEGSGDALVGGTTTTTDLIVGDDASVANSLTVNPGNTFLYGNLTVFTPGNTMLYGLLTVNSNSYFYSNVIVTQNTYLQNTLNVTGNSTFSNGRFNGTMNADIARINVAYITTLTVTDPILAPAVSADSIYVLRYGTSTDGDGIFRVKRSTASGNADIYWNEVANTYQFLTDNRLANATMRLKAHEDYVAFANISGNVTADLSVSNWFRYNLSGNANVTFVNAPVTGNGKSITVIIKQNTNGSNGKTIGWGNTILWAGGLVPPSTNTANANDVWQFTTVDGGASYMGTLAVKDAR